jgi:hypothetical protein
VRTLFHFIKRDLLDSWFGWSLVLAFSALYYFMRQESRALVFLFIIYYLHFIFSSTCIWGSRIEGTSLSRYYLQSLPLKRRTLFWFCVLRSMVSGVPLLIFMMLLPRIVQGAVIDDTLRKLMLYAAHFPMYVACLLLVLFFSTCFNCRASLFNEAFRKTVGRFRRIGHFLFHLIVDSILSIMAQLSTFVFLSVLYGENYWQYCALAFGGLLFNIWQLKRCYRNWMWES